ncbi:MAG: heme-binding protein [Xanthomonadales bacterium]|nr:heme-binding protein [Gammaproteobacteria bacterium]MBT8052940.1 heme-binding protein [Gammaproteobacteria bacterium]NND57832.1 heme-binding protein [Xanthomonadales bacterium]NNK50711.1 heme-binding protein [Xanthomonadales bacterium]
MRKALMVFVFALAAFPMDSLVAIEEAQFTVVHADEDIEVRDYEPSIVAETLVDDDFEDAGGRAFRKLFNYISGDNQAQDKIAMTSPVSQKKRSEKIAMTSPVEQRPAQDGWAVSFMMPASYSMDTIPQPTDPDVFIREVPAYRAAAIRFSGRWTQKNYRKHLEELQNWITKSEYRQMGKPVWARYDPPFKPWFMRRNEILIPVQLR